MTAADLIQRLQQFPADMPVHFAYNYGDYWSTTVAPAADNVEIGAVKHSTYHGMDKVLDLAEEDEESDHTKAIIIT